MVNDGDIKTSVLNMMKGDSKASATGIAKEISVIQRRVENYIQAKIQALPLSEGYKL